MTRRETSISALLIIIVGLAGAILGRWHALKPLTGPITLRIVFDGGYLWDFDQSNSVVVGALTKAKYKMLVRNYTTAGLPDIALDGYSLQILPDGGPSSPLKPTVPKLDSSQTGCNPDVDNLRKDNRLFIPDLRDAAAQMGTTLKPKQDFAATIVLTGGGEVHVDDLGGCVDYRDVNGVPINGWKERSMASGVEGIRFEWPNVASTKVTLKWTSNDGSTSKTADLTPDASNLIILRVSSFDPVPPSYPPPPYKIAHFKDHFGDAFQPYANNKEIALWWRGAYRTSPGIDCPGGGI